MKFALSVIAAALTFNTSVSASTEDDPERITIEGQYLSINESNSVKTPTPIIDVPQSLSIMTAEDITERGITSIGEIIDYTPGVNTSQGEGHRDSVVFRGVRSTADFYIDGNRDDVQYYRSLYNVEQVEILRGPNALLFGRGGTGGILNRVSKKAKLDETFTGYKATLNSFGGYGVEIDTNTDMSSTSALRINAMYESLDNHRDFFDGERIGFNPTARFELSEDSVLDMSYEYINHERFIDRGIPTGADGRPVESLKNVVFGDPENNYHELEAHVFRVNLSHVILLPIEPDDSTQHEAHCLAVHQAEMGGQRIGCRMRRTEHAVLDRDSPVCRCQLQLTARCHIIPVLENHRQRRLAQTK